MATYLCVKASNQNKSFTAKESKEAGKPYLCVKASNSVGYFPLTTETSTGTKIKVKDNNGNVYRIVETYTTSRQITVTTGTSYLTRSSTSNTTYYTRMSTSATTYGTRSSTYQTIYDTKTLQTLTRSSFAAPYLCTAADITNATANIVTGISFTLGNATKTISSLAAQTIRFNSLKSMIFCYNNSTLYPFYSSKVSTIRNMTARWRAGNNDSVPASLYTVLFVRQPNGSYSTNATTSSLIYAGSMPKSISYVGNCSNSSTFSDFMYFINFLQLNNYSSSTITYYNTSSYSGTSYYVSTLTSCSAQVFIGMTNGGNVNGAIKSDPVYGTLYSSYNTILTQTTNTRYATRKSSSKTGYATRSSTSSTSYLTRSSTSSTSYLTITSSEQITTQ